MLESVTFHLNNKLSQVFSLQIFFVGISQFKNSMSFSSSHPPLPQSHPTEEEEEEEDDNPTYPKSTWFSETLLLRLGSDGSRDRVQKWPIGASDGLFTSADFLWISSPSSLTMLRAEEDEEGAIESHDGAAIWKKKKKKVLRHGCVCVCTRACNILYLTSCVRIPYYCIIVIFYLLGPRTSMEACQQIN